jgi:hypothetical protein
MSRRWIETGPVCLVIGLELGANQNSQFLTIQIQNIAA